MRLEQWQIDYIRENKDVRPRARLARDTGLCVSTVYRHLRKAGAEMDYSLCQRAPGVEETVARLYPVMSRREIYDAVGITKATVDRVVRKLGLRHTPETEERLKAKSIAMPCNARTAETYRRIAQRRRAQLKAEYARVDGGEPQRTRLRLKKLPRKTYAARWHLAKRAGYTYVEDDPWALVRPERAVRKINESFYESKYRLSFIDSERDERERGGAARDALG